MSLNPARMYKLKAGTLSEEASADIVVFNPNETYIPNDYASKSSNSPFTGMELKGKVKYTLVGGKVVYRA
jgi:dihydroorotase